MDRKDVILRNELESEHRVVEELTREAFWNHFVPGCNEHYLLHIMRSVDAFIPALDIVALVNGTIVGNIVYTRSTIIEDKGGHKEVITIGPLSVLPEFQGRGIGGILIEYTKQLAKDMGYSAILIYGDPDYYCRFGFVAAEEYRIGTADNMYADALLALELYPGALADMRGTFHEDPIFEVDEDQVKTYDKSFSPKALVDNLPTQLRFRYLVKKRKPRT